MFNFEQRKLIAQLGRDMKKLGLKADYSDLTKKQRIRFEIDEMNSITIWVCYDCFLDLSLSNDIGFARVAVDALDVANKFMENYRKIDMEVTA
ncbi:hypothetical protein [Limosilactobacillus reuteri]|uniref:hypothetical protein n=1 Tax=Limosilactobacillus reuteri TaxID=1598 RepID=UPI000A1DC49E|nr:hypothetical protein [Limosilactobacillus reuteri]